MIKLAIGLLTAIGACNACTPSTNPTPTPAPNPPDGNPTALVVAELVDAGCLQADDSGNDIASVSAQEHSDAAAPWLQCLYAGGTVKSCAVPCGSGE